MGAAVETSTITVVYVENFSVDCNIPRMRCFLFITFWRTNCSIIKYYVRHSPDSVCTGCSFLGDQAARTWNGPPQFCDEFKNELSYTLTVLVAFVVCTWTKH